MIPRTRISRWGVAAAAALMAVAGLPASTVSAAPDDAADFAADCNADGEVIVTATKRYVGGTGNLTRTCLVTLGDGTTLVFREVSLTGAGFETYNPYTNTTIKVIDSVIDFAADPTIPFLSGVLGIYPGGNAGYAAVPESNGRVVIRGSKVTADVIHMSASFDWPDGAVIIKDSTLAATVRGITLRASDLGGSAGIVKVVRSDLLAATDVVIKTGNPARTEPGGGSFGLTKVIDSFIQAGGSIFVHGSSDGRVVVRRTAISGATAEIRTGVRGTCISTGNTPPIPCT